jgi:hypothetical protein
MLKGITFCFFFHHVFHDDNVLAPFFHRLLDDVVDYRTFGA